MGHTFVEKVMGQKTHKPVHAGEFVVVDVDCMMASDTTGPFAIKAFLDMGGKNLHKPDKSYFILDHATPCPNQQIANLHKLIRDFCSEQGAILYDQGEGVCHQIMLEKGLVKEGDIVLGADSHSCTYGAVGAFSTGVGSTDLGAALLTGKTWLRVPYSIKIELTGELPSHVSAKDVILQIIGDVKSDGCTYMAVEFDGDGFASFTADQSATICNMVIEMGAKSGMLIPSLTDPRLIPDPDAVYNQVLHYNANDFMPVVACPHTVDNVKPVKELNGQKVDLVYMGSCTNGRLEDLKIAADILRGRKLARYTRMIISPASATVLTQAMQLGYMADLVDAGAIVITPGCGLCVGTLGGVPADNEVVLSTTNRNFLGRMGNNKALVYLSSPLTAAVSALTGYITDPGEVLN